MITTTKERSIILRGHEVRGILEKRQTQIRRVIKNVPEGDGFHVEPANNCLVIQRPGFDVGKARLVDCVEHHDSPWFFGPRGFVFERPEAIDLVPCKGQLGFFNVEIPG